MATIIPFKGIRPVKDQLTKKIIAFEPEYDFTSADKVRHILWTVKDTKVNELIEKRFSEISAVYIADGHHRSASSALLGKSRQQKNPGYTGKEPFNYYLGEFFPESQLKIYDFNRVVNSLSNPPQARANVIKLSI